MMKKFRLNFDTEVRVLETFEIQEYRIAQNVYNLDGLQFAVCCQTDLIIMRLSPMDRQLSMIKVIPAVS